MQKKSTTEKLFNTTGLPKIVDIPPRMHKRCGQGRMVVPAPAEIYELIKSIPEGKVMSYREIREAIAQKHSADTTCPMVTGLAVQMTARYAVEVDDGLIPYWRVVKDGGFLNERFPGGIESQARRLAAEGHSVEWLKKSARAV